jgi:hypothetical protein
MDTVAAYSFGSLAWLSAQAVPLVIWPSFVGSLLRAEQEAASGAQKPHCYYQTRAR